MGSTAIQLGAAITMLADLVGILIVFIRIGKMWESHEEHGRRLTVLETDTVPHLRDEFVAGIDSVVPREVCTIRHEGLDEKLSDIKEQLSVIALRIDKIPLVCRPERRLS